MVAAGVDEHSNRYRSQHWHKRAQEAWEMARQIEDQAAKYEIQTIAVLYEAMAAYMESRRYRQKAD